MSQYQGKPEKKWYAIYTKSRTEKKVASDLEASGIEIYLPLLKILRQWSDRKKWVEVPLFSCYLFVHISERDYPEVLKTNGVVRFITFRNKRIPIPDQQIEAVRAYLDEDDPVKLNETNFQPGDFVEVIRGQMLGLTGTLVQVKGKQRVLVEIAGIGQKLIINISKSVLKLQNGS